MHGSQGAGAQQCAPATRQAELHFIRARLQGGILSKARRGELQMPLPVGLSYDPTGKVVLDPDQSVQHALRHVFTTFARTGSARSVVAEFTREGLLFPTRIRKGHRTGELAWTELGHWRVLRTLHNPRYAGAFAYGRRSNRKTIDGKISSRVLPREQWTSLIPDAHPGVPHLGAVRAQPAHARRERPRARPGPCRRPRPRRLGAAARPRRLRSLRKANVSPISPAPRHARPGLPLHPREHPTPRPAVPDDPRPTRRRNDQPTAARHRHPARLGGRAHRPSRARIARR